MDGARPGEEFVEGRSHSFVTYGIGVREENRRVREPRFVGGDPIKIALAVRSEAKTLVPPLRGQIESIFLALEIERKKGFDPLGWVLRLGRVLGVGCRAADFELLGEDGQAIVVEVEETLREVSADFPLDLRSVGMDETVAEGITRGLALLGSHAIAELPQQAARAVDGNEQIKSDDKRAEGLDEQGLH